MVIGILQRSLLNLLCLLAHLIYFRVSRALVNISVTENTRSVESLATN